MKILGIDSSAKSASAAVTENGKILSSFLINTGLTHSETLMPMVENVLRCAKISLNDIDLIAVNNGPGSFTGIRIGVAAVKGMADALSIPCAAISTLESMAYNLIDFDCIVCASMDARCSQVYNALFDITDGKITRLTEDTAIPVKNLEKMLKNYNKIKICVGDGAEICYNALKANIDDIKIACEMLRYQSASGVCFAAQQREKSFFVKGKDLVPYYLRLPQAERELNNKLNK